MKRYALTFAFAAALSLLVAVPVSTAAAQTEFAKRNCNTVERHNGQQKVARTRLHHGSRSAD